MLFYEHAVSRVQSIQLAMCFAMAGFHCGCLLALKPGIMALEWCKSAHSWYV